MNIRKITWKKFEIYIFSGLADRMNKGVIVRQNSDEIKDTFSARNMAEKFERLLRK